MGEAMAAFQQAVLTHAKTALRDLPWRDTRDPWQVCVSEVMLQQTTVQRVVPYYTRFLTLFPTVSACANAPQADVVQAFVGLGYNRRAVMLHRTAQAVRDQHGGVFPHTLTDLLALPGVGPYTARAILAFAYEQDVAVVDTNVSRLLARSVAGRPLNKKEVQALADKMVPDGHGWLWNQGILDFSATICTKRAPGCDVCPYFDGCVWQGGRNGQPDDPADGSAFVTTRQSTFVGSDREGRGRIVHALTAGPVERTALAAITGWDDDARIAKVLAGLERDGLIVCRNGRLELVR